MRADAAPMAIVRRVIANNRFKLYIGNLFVVIILLSITDVSLSWTNGCSKNLNQKSENY